MVNAPTILHLSMASYLDTKKTTVAKLAGKESKLERRKY
jgi:hypothetical protein